MILDDDLHTQTLRRCERCGGSDVYCFSVTRQSAVRSLRELTGATLATLIFVGFLVRAVDSAIGYVFVLSCIALFSYGALRPVWFYRNRIRNPPLQGSPRRAAPETDRDDEEE